ncbi:hypothetical protein EMIT051CA3_10128 [Pseudomonas chlororaphis]
MLARHGDSPPQGFEAAEYKANKYLYQLRNIAIRTEFTFFTISLYGFYVFIRLRILHLQ